MGHRVPPTLSGCIRHCVQPPPVDSDGFIIKPGLSQQQTTPPRTAPLLAISISISVSVSVSINV